MNHPSAPIANFLLKDVDFSLHIFREKEQEKSVNLFSSSLKGPERQQW